MDTFFEYLSTNQNAFTVLGILLTLFISLLSLFFNLKSNKAVRYLDSVTKNRVEWIDKLRKLISEFFAILDTQDLTDSIITPDELRQYPFGNDFRKLKQIGYEVKLMLNFSDDLDGRIMQQIDFIIVSYKNLLICIRSSILDCIENRDEIYVPNESVIAKQNELELLTEKLLSDMQIYLKSEWNRVKCETKGEIYEKETQIFDIEELIQKKADCNYKNNTWKKYCINTKAKCKRILNSHQFTIAVFIVACVVLIWCIPIIVEDIVAIIKYIKGCLT